MIRILLVNQFLFLCDALAAVLEEEPDMLVAGRATTVRDALNLAPQSDVVLVNIQMTDGDTFKLIREITDSGLSAKILVLGLTESKEQVLQYVQAGATGYVLKDDSVEDLLLRIRDAHSGKVRVSPDIASALMSRLKEYSLLLSQVNTSVGESASLTAREQEIMDLIGQGFTNQEIAEQLVIEVGTVKNHVHNILQKLDASTRQEAAATWVIVKEGERIRSGIF